MAFSRGGSWTKLMTRMDTLLERFLFVAFIVTTDSFVAMNMAWVFLAASWGSVLSGLVPILSLATLASFLAFALLEDHLRTRV